MRELIPLALSLLECFSFALNASVLPNWFLFFFFFLKIAHVLICIFLMKVKVIQLCLTLCNPMDCTVRGILQARILEWVAVPFSRGSSQPRDQTQVSRIEGAFFTIWDTREAQTGGMVTRGRLVGGRQRGWRKASLTGNLTLAAAVRVPNPNH